VTEVRKPVVEKSDLFMAIVNALRAAGQIGDEIDWLGWRFQKRDDGAILIRAIHEIPEKESRPQ